MQHIDADQVWALALVYGTAEERARIKRQVAVALGDKCPSCGGASIETNGADRWLDLTYRCTACGHSWDAADVAVELPAAAERGKRRARSRVEIGAKDGRGWRPVYADDVKVGECRLLGGAFRQYRVRDAVGQACRYSANRREFLSLAEVREHFEPEGD